VPKEYQENIVSFVGSVARQVFTGFSHFCITEISKMGKQATKALQSKA
jgi:hypothetical protein